MRGARLAGIMALPIFPRGLLLWRGEADGGDIQKMNVNEINGIVGGPSLTKDLQYREA
ncbi:MAG: hypothetical protein RLZZ444_1079 [Pseudomonadota bacterium]